MSKAGIPRHPGYAGALPVVRTSLEDRTRRERLDGYREYAKRVPHLLVPGIW
jgi:protein-S-isoprenylcysteine O-methyltransferase Ste14